MYRRHASGSLMLLFTALLIFPVSLFSLDQEEALAELAQAHSLLRAGETFELSSDLIGYLYRNRESFPRIPQEASSEERMGLMIQPYSQLANLSNVMLRERSMRMDEDTARVFAVLGYLNVRMVPLSLEFMSGFDPADPTYQTRKQGIDQALVGVCNMYLGYLLVLFVEETPASVRDILLSDLRRFSPDLLEALPEEFADQVRAFMTDRIEPEVRPELSADFAEILAAAGV